MGPVWREWILTIIGQACCVGVGIWLFAVQVVRELGQNGGPTPQGGGSLVVIGALTVFWVVILQSLTSFLFISGFRDGLKRRDARTAHENMRQMQQFVRAQDAIIFGLAKLAESRDPDTGRHLDRISEYSRILAKAARLDDRFTTTISPEFIRLIQLASALHDIGKVGIEDHILLKPGPLDEHERARMEDHTHLAVQCLDEIVRRVGCSPLLQMAREIALGHHERWDGEGYPYGLVHDEIPLAARIVSIVDVYDALRSARPYKAPLSHAEAREYLTKAAGTHFDPELVRIWLTVEGRFDAIAAASGDARPACSRFIASPPDEEMVSAAGTGAENTLDRTETHHSRSTCR